MAAQKQDRTAGKSGRGFLGEIEVLPFEIPADAAYGKIRADLEAAGKPIGSNDILIAAHAHALGATVVTANAREFKRGTAARSRNG